MVTEEVQKRRDLNIQTIEDAVDVIRSTGLTAQAADRVRHHWWSWEQLLRSAINSPDSRRAETRAISTGSFGGRFAENVSSRASEAYRRWVHVVARIRTALLLPRRLPLAVSAVSSFVPV